MGFNRVIITYTFLGNLTRKVVRSLDGRPGFQVEVEVKVKVLVIYFSVCYIRDLPKRTVFSDYLWPKEEIG